MPLGYSIDYPDWLNQDENEWAECFWKTDKMKPVENVKRPKLLWKDLLIAKFPIVKSHRTLAVGSILFFQCIYRICVISGTWPEMPSLFCSRVLFYLNWAFHFQFFRPEALLFWLFLASLCSFALHVCLNIRESDAFRSSGGKNNQFLNDWNPPSPCILHKTP